MRAILRIVPISLAVTAVLLGVVLGARSDSRTLAAVEPIAGSGSLHVPTDVITSYVYLPLVAYHDPSLSVNPQDRQASLDFYTQVYLASEDVSIDWTGNHATCGEGTTSKAFRQAVQLRINYFRAMAGVPADLTLSDEYNAKAQKAALMMSVNRRLSHAPDPSWTCYSAEGAEAAGSSNLYLGVYGPTAISGYIYDPGSGNYAVGHRRWILYPQTRTMGTGDIPPADGYPPSNALWVFDANLWGPRPETREAFVAWPPPGYVPSQVVYPRWSLSYGGADFTWASVSMKQGDVTVPVVVRPLVNGYGENTLVWEPQINLGVPPASDTTYTVSVTGVIINSSSRDFTYAVTLFDASSAYAAATASLPVGRIGVPPEHP
ncbi:MAG: CAP domain-containing protein [Anaerolineae bacterium]|nr:CAP domain-containing protein [Anaerolineae bacterium]